MDIPFLIDGEILDVMADTNVELFPTIRYRVRAHFPWGDGFLVNVQQANMFGGINDFFEIRRRGSMESGKTYSIEANNDAQQDSKIGDRVLISFLGGQLNRPVIVGAIPHPKMNPWLSQKITSDVHNFNALKPSLSMRYLGLEIEVDDNGQFHVTHNGAPAIEEIDASSGGLLGSLSGALSGAIGGIGASSVSDELPPTDSGNPAVKNVSASYKTKWEFLSKGEFRLYDADGNMLELDRVSKQIRLSNSGRSTVDGELVGSDDQEHVLIDGSKLEQLLELHARTMIRHTSRKDIEEIADNNITRTIGNNEIITIKNDYDRTISGSSTVLIKKDVKWTVSGTVKNKVTGAVDSVYESDFNEKILGKVDTKISKDWLIDANNNKVELTSSGVKITDNKNNIITTDSKGVRIQTSQGSVLSLENGKIAIGNQIAELADLLGQTLKQLQSLSTALQAEIHPTPNGPSGPPMNAASYVQFNAQCVQIETLLNQIKGKV